MQKKHIFSKFMIEILGNYSLQDRHFFAVVATSLIIREATKQEMASIPTAGICYIKGDPNIYLLYNTDFTDELSEKELRFLFFHEIFHVILYTKDRTTLHNHDPRLVNIAHDMVINSLIKEHYGDDCSPILNEKGKILEIPADYKGIRNYESVYNDIKDKSDEAGGLKQMLQKMGITPLDGEAGQDSNGNPNGQTLDVHLDPSELDMDAENALENLTAAVDRGLSTSSMRQAIDGIFPEKSINVLDYISKYTKAMKGNVPKPTWYKRNRKQPGFLKGKKKRIVYFNLILDTSGSMGDDDMTGLLEAVMRNGISFKLIQIDTKIQEVILIKKISELHQKLTEFKGRGGTILQPALNYCKKHEPESPCVVLTDGWTDTLTFHSQSLIVTTGSECPVSNEHMVTQIKYEKQ